MKLKITPFVLLLICLVSQNCQVPTKVAKPVPDLEGTAYLTIPSDLKKDKNLSAQIVTIIEKDEEVLILERSDVSFYKVKYKDYEGYVSKTNLTKLKPVKHNYLSPLSTYSADGDANNCRSVQCSGTTKKGGRCKNTTTNCSGRCYLH